MIDPIRSIDINRTLLRTQDEQRGSYPPAAARDGAQFSARKSPFGECFGLDWAQTGVERGWGVAQNTPRKHAGALVPGRTGGQDGLGWWGEQYLQHAVTTRPAAQQVQHHDLGLFLRSLQSEEGTDQRLAPRLARTFQPHLRQTWTPEGHRAWSDKMIQRILAPLKTFATWGHTHEPFPLGPPMAAIALSALGTGLEVDRTRTQRSAGACSMRPICS